jgi:hypothetical protein
LASTAQRSGSNRRDHTPPGRLIESRPSRRQTPAAWQRELQWS